MYEQQKALKQQFCQYVGGADVHPPHTDTDEQEDVKDPVTLAAPTYCSG